MKTRTILIPLLITTSLLVTFFVWEFEKNNKNEKNQNTKTETKQILKQLKIGNSYIEIETANTPDEKELGLGNRINLNENAGMLFDFSSYPSTPTFWMKNMKFDLDIIWIQKNSIIQITKNIPAPKNEADDLPTYKPDAPVEYVLELNSGYAEKHNLKPGDQIEFIY